MRFSRVSALLLLISEEAALPRMRALLHESPRAFPIENADIKAGLHDSEKTILLFPVRSSVCEAKTIFADVVSSLRTVIIISDDK